MTENLFADTLRGARAGSPLERGSFGALSAFSTTILVSRSINYAREQRRPAPQLRSAARRAYGAVSPRRGGFHHFLPGIALAFTAGGAAAVSDPRRAFMLSVPYGIGVGLTVDEVALLLGHANAYWGSEGAALLATLAPGVVAAGLALRFAQRGGRAPVRSQ